MARQIVQIDLDELRNDYLSGASMRSLARKHRTTRPTIAKKLRSMGVKILSSRERVTSDPEAHRRASARRGHKSTTAMPVKERLAATTNEWDKQGLLRKLYVDEKRSCAEIAKRLGCHRETIRSRLHRHGIPVRSIGEASRTAAARPDTRARRSRASSSNWLDEDYRKRVSGKLRGKSVKMPPEHSNNVSAAMTRHFSDPDNVRRHAEKIRRSWNKPTEAMLKHLGNLHDGLRNDGEMRRKLLRTQSDRFREEKREQAFKHWADEDFLKKGLPTMKRKCSEAARRAWKDQVYRRKVLDSISRNSTSRLERVTTGILDDLGIAHCKRRFGRQMFEFDVCIGADELRQDRGLLIEVNGLYVHSRSKQIERDTRRHRFWEKHLSDEWRFETVWEHDMSAYRVFFNRMVSMLGIRPERRSVRLRDLELTQIEHGEASSFYDKYHYLGRHRRGVHLGAMLDGSLVACCAFAAPTRMETAARLGLEYGEVRELSRFCISPLVHDPNMASFVLSRCRKLYSSGHPEVRAFVTFADGEMGHLGTMYLASNWKLDGTTAPSYFYEMDSLRWHKKTVWDHARSVGASEREFAEAVGMTRVQTGRKRRFVLFT